MPTLPDIDTLQRLARSNPGELERRRRRWVNELIAAAPEASRARLRGLQFTIDMERQRARTPLDGCMRLHDLMMDSCAALSSALKGECQSSEHTDAKVLAFPLTPRITG